ncbi:MAG: hypothetical protein NDJ72_00260 [Elusimicrobia bacterium]|nr:hypothetical protein [Elusimicrobiota bacterium]
MNIEPSQHYVLNLSGHILFLYLAAAMSFYAIMIGNLRLLGLPSESGKAKKSWAAWHIILVTLASNFIGTAAVALLSRSLQIPSRQTMAFIPLLLLVERHVRLSLSSPNDRRDHALALAGAAAGLLAGAAVFFGSDIAQETFTRVLLPSDIPTMPVADAVQNPGKWSISLQLVFFYCLILAVFESAHHYLNLWAKSMGEGLRAGRWRETAAALASALGANFMLVALFVLLGSRFDVQLRLAMFLLPLYVIMESYVMRMRADLANRRSYLLGLGGSALGMLTAGLLFLRHAPIH